MAGKAMKYSIGQKFKGVEIIRYDDDGYLVKHVHPDPDTGKLPTCKPYMMKAEGLRKRRSLETTNPARCKQCKSTLIPFQVRAKEGETEFQKYSRFIDEECKDIILLDKIMPARPYKRLTGEIARK